MLKRGDGIVLACASLIENPLRTALTLLGIAIGVTAVILVVSIIQGLDRYIANTIGNLGPSVFVVSRFAISKDKDYWDRAWRRNPELRMDDAEALRRRATLVDKVGVTRQTRSRARHGSTTISDVSLKGISGDVLEIEPYEIEQGRGFAPAEHQRAARVCIIGYDVAQQLFPDADPLGKDIQLLRRHFRVVGVGKKKGSAFGQSQDIYALMPLETLQKLRGNRGWLNFSLHVRSPERMAEAIDEARTIMRTRQHVPWNEEDTFGIITSEGVMDFWRDLTQMIFRVAIFVVSISLVVGGIVIMNIMLLSVVERTREIGIRKAIGARQEDIEFQFLVESILLCALGGVLGVLVGWGGTWLIDRFTPLPASFPLWAPGLAIALTSAVGIFFGLHPAKSAGQLDPIDALRRLPG